MDEIVRISSSAPWEPIFGYSRAVRAGEWVAVSGSTGIDESGQLVGRGQIYVQARQAISNIAAALRRMGLGLDRVVRTRVYVTELNRFGDLARAHQEMFGAAPPASTVVQVTRLVHPDMLVEIEADAYAGPDALPPREYTKICPLELTATPTASPRYRSAGSLRKSGTER